MYSTLYVGVNRCLSNPSHPRIPAMKDCVRKLPHGVKTSCTTQQQGVIAHKKPHFHHCLLWRWLVACVYNVWQGRTKLASVSFSEQFTQDGVRLATSKFAWSLAEPLLGWFSRVVTLHSTSLLYFVEVCPAVRWQKKSNLNVKINPLAAFQCWSSQSARRAPHVTI